MIWCPAMGKYSYKEGKSISYLGVTADKNMNEEILVRRLQPTETVSVYQYLSIHIAPQIKTEHEDR